MCTGFVWASTFYRVMASGMGENTFVLVLISIDGKFYYEYMKYIIRYVLTLMRFFYHLDVFFSLC